MAVPKIFLVASMAVLLCVASCSSASEEQGEARGEAAEEIPAHPSQESNSQSVPETPSAPEEAASRQSVNKETAQSSEQELKEKGEEKEEVKKEKYVVAYVPDYPLTVTRPLKLSSGTHFIMFYASWCTHSADAMPHFRDALQYVVDMNMTDVHMGKMEVTRNGEIAKNFKIKSTPTFIMYHRGAQYVFEDEINSDNFVSFMHQVLEINMTVVNTSAHLSELRRLHPILFLLAYDTEADPDWHPTFTRVAQEKGLLGKFLYTTKTDLVQDFEVTKFPTMLVLKDGQAHKFSDSLSQINLGKWVTRERYTALPVADAKTFRPFTKFVIGRKIAVLLVHEDPADQRITEKRVIDTVRRVALSRKLFPHIQFVQLTSLELAEKITQSPITQLPYLFVYEPRTGYHYPFQAPEGESGVTEAAIIDFCGRVRHKKVEPQGGAKSYMNVFTALWQRISSIYQTMVTHRPYLSLGAGFSVLGVMVFYTILCFKKPPAVIKRPKKLVRRRRGHRRQPHPQTNIEGNGSIRRRRREEGGREGRGEDREEGEGEEEMISSNSGSESHSYSEEDGEDLKRK